MKLNLALGLAMLAALAASLLAGSVWLSPADLLSGDLGSIILVELRLPRALLGLGLGLALGASGAVMQGYLRNPLADPGIFGVSSSAALGAVASLFFGYAAAPYLLPLFALGGAAVGMALLALIAGRSASLVLFTLAGMILSSLTASLTALAISLAPNPFAATEIMTWLMGGLTDRGWAEVRLALPPIALGLLLLAGTGRSLDALTLGEAAARSLGVSPGRLQALVVAGVGLCVGGAVAAAGVIGFVGLIVPHLVRPLVGHRPSVLILPSALAGALLLLIADAVVRLLPLAAELRLGIMLSLLGAPFFLALLIKMRREVA